MTNILQDVVLDNNVILVSLLVFLYPHFLLDEALVMIAMENYSLHVIDLSKYCLKHLHLIFNNTEREEDLARTKNCNSILITIQHGPSKIQFSLKIETNGTVSFLDILVNAESPPSPCTGTSDG